MILGTAHLGNPGQDIQNVHVDDMLAPKRQAELAAISEGLQRFHPTAIALEWPDEVIAERFPRFTAGTLEPTPNEVVQIGFRLAKDAGVTRVSGIDVDGDFPYEAVQAYAAAHGMADVLAGLEARIGAQVAAQETRLAQGTVGSLLRALNEPAAIRTDNGFYRALLRIGGGKEQPAAELVAAWQKRNILICARLIQLAEPGDRIVVMFGSGHAHLLRQCVDETPGFRLVEPNDYLPQ